MARTMGDTGTYLGMRTSPDREPCHATQDVIGIRLVPPEDISIPKDHHCADDGAWVCSCGAIVDDGSKDDWRKTWQKTTVGDCPTCGRVRREWYFEGYWQTTDTTKRGHK